MANDPVPENDGQALLLAVPDSLAVIAERVGVQKPAVSSWRTGAKKPGDDTRARLLAEYGIPVTAWDMKPGAGDLLPGEVGGDRLRRHVRELGADRETVLAAVERGALPSTPDLLDEQIEILRNAGATTGMSASELVRCADAMGRLLSRRSDMEAAQADLLAIILRHPDWVRFWESLERKMADRPEVLRDLLDEVKAWRFTRG